MAKVESGLRKQMTPEGREMAGAYKYRPQYTQNTLGPTPPFERKPTMRQVFAVIDGMVTGIIAFEKEEDAKAWASQNQTGGESLTFAVQAVTVYPDVASAPKNPEFF